ncbi:MAG: gliding motility protein GldM [Flavicella sp.]
MAGGKQSARQKMISLMYLVFIAMLALNMSKQVLSSFGYLNAKLEDSNSSASLELKNTLANLNKKASEQEAKYGELNKKAIQIHKKSDEFYDFLQMVKDTLISTIDPEIRNDYQSLDTETAGNEFFFAGDTKNTENGDKFIALINGYRDDLIDILGPSIRPAVKNNLIKRFDTSPQPTTDGGEQPWIRNRYAGFPLVATLTNLSVIQSDIRNTEKEIYSSLLGKQLEADAGISANTYSAIVIPSKPAYFSGEQFEGKIVLGRYDASLLPDKVMVNGREEKGRENGAAVVKFKTGNIGENAIKGNFIFKQDGKNIEIPINSSYMVIPKPNAAVVSADKMNVVYRGVENPITISIPGVTDNNVTASAPGLKKGKGIGKYILSPKNGTTCVINVTGKTSSGEIIKSPPVTFRIKDIPAPATTIRGQNGTISLPKSSLLKSTIAASLIDFDFDLNINVSSFKVKVPGQSTVLVKGKKFDAKAKRVLMKARRGEIVTIFDVKTSIVGNSSYRMKKPSPLLVTISN